MSDLARIHLFAEGRVQGVGFRYYVLEKATSLKINGWVRNLHDDRVEIIAEADRMILTGFIDLVRTGPKNAFVSDLKIEWLPSEGNHYKFFIAPSE